VYGKAILKTTVWLSLGITLFLCSLTTERFSTGGLDQKVEPKFTAKSLLRSTESLSNALTFQAKRVENSFFCEISHEVKGTLDQFDFSCDKLTLDKKEGLFLEGNVTITDTLEKKSLYAPYARILPKEGILEVFDHPILLQHKGLQSKILAKKVLYLKTPEGYKAFVEGPIECIIDDIDVKNYAPFKREKPL
jgi:hypothetical protein